jgi:hypothetical protein
VQECGETSCKFVVPCENASIPFDLVDEALDQMALLIEMPVIVPLFGAVFLGRNDCLGTVISNRLEQCIDIVGSVGNQMLELKGVDQRLGLCTVMALSASQDEAEWIAQCIDKDVNLGAESAPTPA